MLTQRPDDIPALFTTPCILQEPVDNSLFDFCTSLSLTTGDFNERLVHALDGQSFGFAKCEALLLLGFKGDISGIAMLIVDSLQRAVV